MRCCRASNNAPIVRTAFDTRRDVAEPAATVAFAIDAARALRSATRARRSDVGVADASRGAVDAVGGGRRPLEKN